MIDVVADIANQATDWQSRLRNGIFWNLVAAAFNQGSTFVTNIILANILGRDEFGEFAIIQTTILTLSMIAQAATGYTATRYVSEHRSTDKVKTGQLLGLCTLISGIMACVAALILLFGAPLLAGQFLKAPHLSTGLTIATGFAFFSVMISFQMGALAGLESYLSLAKAGIIGGCLWVTVTSLAAMKWGLSGAIAGIVFSAAIQWLLQYFYLRQESAAQEIHINYSHLWQHQRIIFRFALPAAMSGLITLPALWLASVFLVRQQDGYAQMALYSAANSLRVLALFIPRIINNVGMSLLNNQKEKAEIGYRSIFQTNLLISVGAVLGGAIVITICAPFLVKAFGKDFGGAYPVLLVLMLSTLPEGISTAVYQIVQNHEKIWQSFWAIALPREILIIISAWFLTQWYGAVGLAWAYLTGVTVALFLTLIVALMAHQSSQTRHEIRYCHETK